LVEAGIEQAALSRPLPAIFHHVFGAHIPLVKRPDNHTRIAPLVDNLGHRPRGALARAARPLVEALIRDHEQAGVLHEKLPQIGVRLSAGNYRPSGLHKGKSTI